MRKVVLSRARTWGLLLLLVFVLCGCRTLGYYKQAVQGQVEIWQRQQPIANLLADPRTPAPLQEKLTLVQRMREFARFDLQLTVDGHYTRYADLGRRFVVWNVYAAPELSLEPKRWWYPFVGRLKYRGYFNEPLARKYGAELEKCGYDVYVGGVEAYSTLGWFKDPVLNTFIHHSESDLAEILFHELSHQRVFVGGDTDFNEAFATAVAQEAVYRWLSASNKTNLLQEYRENVRREEQFVKIVLRARDDLKALYADLEAEKESAQPQLSDEAARRQKTEIINRLRLEYQELKAQWGGYTGYDAWFSRPINNARLNTIEAYYKFVPGFRRLLQNHGGDLPAFFVAVEELGKLPKEERHERLEELGKAKAADAPAPVAG